MFENHCWTCNAGDGSEGELGMLSNDSDLLRLCFADFASISPLNPSIALCL